MTSFLSRMANEATAALSDAYGHVVHGDDAGSSARVVWVVHPTKVPIEVNIGDVGGGGGGGEDNAMMMMKEKGMGRDEGGNGGGVGASSPGRTMSSSYLFTQKFDLGLTFLEINDRAYVRTVDPGSLAERAGIQPRDCVQLACVAGGPHFEDLSPGEDENDKRSSSSSTGGGTNIMRRNNGSGGRRNAEESERRVLEARASRFVLECEKRGMRTGYEELRDLFAGCTLPPRGDGNSSNNNTNNNGDNKNGTKNSSLTTPPRTVVPSPPQSSKHHHHANNDDDFTIGSNSLVLADSVGGMFESTSSSRRRNNNGPSSSSSSGRRRGRNDNVVSGRRVPSLPDRKTAVRSAALGVTNVAREAAGRCFDPDDAGNDDGDNASSRGGFFGEEDDGGGTRRRKGGGVMGSSGRRMTLPDTPMSPIKGDNILPSHDPSSPSGGHRATAAAMAGTAYADGVVEQSLWPVVMVFRRTVQRRRMMMSSSLANGLARGWGSPGLSLKGSLFGIPSFRMDDECDRAAALIRQLAPSRGGPNGCGGGGDGGGASNNIFYPRDGSAAPASSSNNANDDADENIEASTIRGMIGAAVGLGFVRLSKVVVGVSLQGGSGIIVSRLPDGTWSAPSAMGVYGLGVGLQFGLEVADFVFVIQTREGMEHFKRGTFVVGGNIGAAVVNCGREAYGAASLGVCTGPLPLEEEGLEGMDLEEGANNDDNNNNEDDNTSAFDESTYQSNASTVRSERERQRMRQHQSKKKEGDIAPMVAYAKSQGLYFGVSVDGLKFFTRNDINARTYKFSVLGEMPAKDILGGLVMPPPEAEDLYSALHSVEFTHEMTELLPRQPEILRRDSMNDWRFDRSLCAVKGEIVDSNSDADRRRYGDLPLYSFLETLDRGGADEFARFETKFKKFLYGGVSVQHLLPHHRSAGMTRREKRTLWLMLPEVGSLRLGFVSKMKDGGDDSSAIMDDITVASSVASSRAGDADVLASLNNARNVKLSTKYSISLTDITTLSQDPNVTIRLSPDDATEHLRVLSVSDVTGKSMLFLADSGPEAELLFSGLKLLLECETSRLGVRGGVPLDQLGGRLGKGALSPLSARGQKSSRGRRAGTDVSSKSNRYHSNAVSRKSKDDLDDRSKYSSFGEPGTSSDDEPNVNDDLSKDLFSELAGARIMSDRHQVPEGRQSWSQLPGRNKMRHMASGDGRGVDVASSPQGGGQLAHQPLQAQAQAPAHYELGKSISSEIAVDVALPLPLALCRVLFLDSSSPVNRAWEAGRHADSDYRHGAWTFPPGSARDFERQNNGGLLSEQKVVSQGSMAGAQRAVSYRRTRNRELVRLSETISVEHDDVDRTLVFSVTDQMPRRGFNARVRIYLKSFKNQGCQARVVAEIRPVGKNLSNQQAVHKAFVLVLDEMKKRYGAEDKGLLAVFLSVCNTLPGYGGPSSPGKDTSASSSRRSQHAVGRSLHSLNCNSQSSIPSRKNAIPENGAAPTGYAAPESLLPGNSNRSLSNKNVAVAPKTPSPSKSSPPQRDSRQSSGGQAMPERPSTPSIRTIGSKTVGAPIPTAKPVVTPDTDEFVDFASFNDVPRNPVTVEVKPLPKIRLDLCPVPREEDEEGDESSISVGDGTKRTRKTSKHPKGSKNSKHRNKHRRSRK